MTNYDVLKEYEAHKTPVPSYDEWQQTQELLKQAETQIIAYKNNDTLPERAFYEKEVEELLIKIDEALQ